VYITEGKFNIAISLNKHAMNFECPEKQPDTMGCSAI
jgi:hypothetical protein